jgi:N-carbamoyl-L-amino-acid hydrolase
LSKPAGVPIVCPPGPLHDAAEVARAGVPTVMMFVQSLHGISHNKIEDTKEEHLALGSDRVRQTGDESATLGSRQLIVRSRFAACREKSDR